MNKKELIINGKQYTLATINKRAKIYLTLQGFELPINVEDIYKNYKFDNVDNIGVVRELLRGDMLNLDNTICDSVELYNAMVINSALIPYLISNDVDFMDEYVKTLKLLNCYDKLKEMVTNVVNYNDILESIKTVVIDNVMRNVLVKPYYFSKWSVSIDSFINTAVNTNAKYYMGYYKNEK